METIISALQNKAVLKQQIYKTTFDVFEIFQSEVMSASRILHESMVNTNPIVPVSFHDSGELEFRLRFSGDLLIFNMHSNIMTLPPEHPALQKPYFKENPNHAYFGQIFIYNFMHDSFRYNRQQDIGYMVARVLINCERKYFIEGVRPLNFIQPEISTEEIKAETLRDILEKSILTSIETDLTSVPVQTMLLMTVGDKIAQNEVRAGEKLGFQFSGKKLDTE